MSRRKKVMIYEKEVENFVTLMGNTQFVKREDLS